MPKFDVTYAVVVILLGLGFLAWCIAKAYECHNMRKAAGQYSVSTVEKLDEWYRQHYDNGDYRAAYRIKAVAIRNMGCKVQSFRQYLFSLYRAHVEDLDTAYIVYKDAVGKKQVDMAIEKIRSLEAKIEKIRKLIREEESNEN